jgi:hypothetical protein
MNVAASPDVVSLATAIDDALDSVCDYLQGTDLTLLPSDVRQALALATAAGDAIDQLLDALGIEDVDGAGGG